MEDFTDNENVPEDRTTSRIFEDLFDKFKGFVFYLQNPFCGNRRDMDATNHIRSRWKEYLGPKNPYGIIPIHDEKGVVDVILGVIALASASRTLAQYEKDMKARGQTKERILSVRRSHQ